MPVRPAVPTATASQVDHGSQLLPGAATCQGDLLLTFCHEKQSLPLSFETRVRCPICLHDNSYPLQVGLHPQQCPMHTQHPPGGGAYVEEAGPV